jgi:HK97 gp10 family phage protein
MAGKYGYRVEEGRGGKIQIDGLKETQKALREMSDDLKYKMKETHREAAEVVVEGSKRYVPFRTGKLAASIRAAATMTSGKVRVGSASVPYAGPIHFGWPARSIKPQPFIYDAMDVRRQEVLEIYSARITGLIDEYNLDQRKIPASRTRDPGATIGGSWEIASTLRDAAGNVTGGVYMDKSGNTKTVRF